MTCGLSVITWQEGCLRYIGMVPTGREVNPNGGGGAFAVISPANIYSVGNEISHWNGSNWTIVDSLTQLSYPSLINTVTFANGEAWACGRTVDATNNFHTLVYRTINANPLFVGGSNQNLSVLPAVAVNIDTFLKVIDNDVSQQLRYTVVSAPVHETLAGFPDTAITNNGFAMPSGVLYTADNGYLGTDQFTARVSVGNVFAETIVHVSVGTIVPLGLVDFFLKKQEKMFWLTG